MKPLLARFLFSFPLGSLITRSLLVFFKPDEGLLVKRQGDGIGSTGRSLTIEAICRVDVNLDNPTLGPDDCGRLKKSGMGHQR